MKNATDLSNTSTDTQTMNIQQANFNIDTQQINPLDQTKASKETNIIKSKPERDYTPVANYLMRDQDLGDLAYRVRSWLHSQHPEWQINTKYIAKVFRRNVQTIQRAMRELKQKGHLASSPKRSKGRFVGWTYKFFSTPFEVSDSKAISGQTMHGESTFIQRLDIQKNKEKTTTEREVVVVHFEEEKEKPVRPIDSGGCKGILLGGPALKTGGACIKNRGVLVKKIDTANPTSPNGTKEEATGSILDSLGKLANGRINRSDLRSWVNKHGSDKVEQVIEYALKQSDIRSFGAYVRRGLENSWIVKSEPPISQPVLSNSKPELTPDQKWERWVEWRQEQRQEAYNNYLGAMGYGMGDGFHKMYTLPKLTESGMDGFLVSQQFKDGLFDQVCIDMGSILITNLLLSSL